MLVVILVILDTLVIVDLLVTTLDTLVILVILDTLVIVDLLVTTLDTLVILVTLDTNSYSRSGI